jgi:hypothetical protein
VTLRGPRGGLADEGARHADAGALRIQLGRQPRGRWVVSLRCSYARPAVIAVEPLLDDGTPFPTTWWLTCPCLAEAVSDLESAGACATWAARIATEPELAERVLSSDARYRSGRAALAAAGDPCAGVGVAGQADPLAVKCLHARLAAEVGGPGDPIGAEVLASLDGGGVGLPECTDDRCRPPSAAPDVAPPG